MDGTYQRKEVYREKKEKKNIVEEFQLANLASLGSLARNETAKYLSTLRFGKGNRVSPQRFLLEPS